MIELKSVSKVFSTRQGSTEALAKLSLSIKQGEVFGIIGASGSGKSTLVRLMNRLERPSSGQVLIEGRDLSKLSSKALSALRHELGMIFQSFGLLNSRTARQNIALALELAQGPLDAKAWARVDDLLAQVGLSEHGHKTPRQLSGGQKQRIAIARALANSPKILLCDEPTSALDPESTQGILELLKALNAELGLTIVIVTHEMDVVRQVCDRVAVLEAGHLAELGAVEEVLFTPKSDVAKALSDQILPPPKWPVKSGELRLKLTYFGDTVSGPALSYATQGLEAHFSIVSGQVSELKSQPYGHLIADIGGADQLEVVERLRQRGVRVTEVLDV